jgi:hypothetical protein
MSLKNEKIHSDEVIYHNHHYVSPYKPFYLNQHSNHTNKRFVFTKPKYYTNQSENKVNLINQNNQPNSKKIKDNNQLKSYEYIRKEMENDCKKESTKKNYKTISEENFKKYLKIAKLSEYKILPIQNKKMINLIDYLVFSYNMFFGIYFVNKLPQIFNGNSLCIFKKLIIIGMNFGITNSILSLYKYYNFKKSFDILFGSLTEYEIFKLLEEYEIEIIL